MARYVAMGRVEAGRVRALAWSGPAPDGDDGLEPGLVCLEPGLVCLEPHAPRRPLDEVLRERWESLREQLAMTTFYLLDAESWR